MASLRGCSGPLPIQCHPQLPLCSISLSTPENYQPNGRCPMSSQSPKSHPDRMSTCFWSPAVPLHCCNRWSVQLKNKNIIFELGVILITPSRRFNRQKSKSPVHSRNDKSSLQDYIQYNRSNLTLIRCLVSN